MLDAGKFSHDFWLFADFFKNNYLEILGYAQGMKQGMKQFGSKLIWFQTVCKGYEQSYQQKTLPGNELMPIAHTY